MRKAILPILTATLLTGAAHAGFYGIGNNTAVTDMTGDGSMVSGYSGATDPASGQVVGDSAFIWTYAQGKSTDTATVSGQTIASIWSIANSGTSYAGVLSDGSAFVRQGATYTRLNPGTAGTQEGIYISKDGSTVTGYNYNWDYTIPASPVDNSAGWVWKNSAIQTYALPSGKTQNDFWSVSQNGSIILGASYSDAGIGVYHWNVTGTPTEMISPNGFSRSSYWMSLSGDGSIAFLSMALSDSIVRYNGLAASPVAISTTGFTSTEIWCTNSTGNIAGGTSHEGAIIWDATNGIRLATTLISSYGIDLTGWQLVNVTAISDDAQTFAGNGKYNGVNQGWVFTLTAVPEPSTYGLIGAGALAFTALVRRRAKRKTV
jgi:hypothetical protein